MTSRTPVQLAGLLIVATTTAAACGDGVTYTDAAGGDAQVADATVPVPDATVPVPDASGVDASGIDASGIDASGVDASGTDASGVDAGGVDASGVDASGIDASGVDASGVDAGTLDAVTTDAASFDGGAAADAGVGPDATAVDAGPPQLFYWADWTAATAGAPGTAVGTFAPPSGAVTISYSGEIYFAQTAGGTNFWVPGDPYVNAVTANAPAHSDIIAMRGGMGVTNTITFDPPVTGLVMGLVSLGAPSANVKYDFTTPITLLSYGAGYWGNGTIVVEPGDVISGSEGHGAIQFVGSVASVTWTIVNAEAWHGFTIGIPAQ